MRVLLLLPTGGHRSSFANVVEAVHVQTFVPDAVVELFNESVVLGLPGSNVVNSGPPSRRGTLGNDPFQIGSNFLT